MNRRTRRVAKAMKRVAMPRASAQLRAVVGATLRRFDRELAARLLADERPAAVPCAPGCAACCDHTVMLTWAEADLLVAQHLDVVREVLPELDRHNTLLRTLGAERGAQSLGESEDAQAALQARWFAQRESCAFLDRASGRYRVYESRPLACRARLVTSAPEACAVRPDAAPELPRAAPYEPRPEYPAAQLALMTATSEALGGPVLMGLLASLVPRVFRERLGISTTIGV